MHELIIKNPLVTLRLRTNHEEILFTVRNFIEHLPATSTSVLEVNYELLATQVDYKDTPMTYQVHANDHGNWEFSYGPLSAQVKVELENNCIQASVWNYHSTMKEHFIDRCIIRPLHFLLAHQQYYFVHAAMPAKGQNCMLIAGESGSGKSTLSLALHAKGYALPADDDCFIRLNDSRPELLPFPTAIGVHDHTLAARSELQDFLIPDFSFGGKKRIRTAACNSEERLPFYNNKLIVFPHYSSGAQAYRSELDPEQALHFFIESDVWSYPGTQNRTLPAEHLIAYRALVKNCKVITLYYNDTVLEDAVELLNGEFEALCNSSTA